ncbi:MAG: hypothetical protein KAT90_02565 [Gammaproteobacteria bacterium]|nr:hypothetical protein [Gammaproteobacteria bacterium]
MTTRLIKDAKKLLAGKETRLEDEEMELLASEMTKLGIKLGFARAYASGPAMMAKLVHELERQEDQIIQIRKALGFK